MFKASPLLHRGPPALLGLLIAACTTTVDLPPEPDHVAVVESLLLADSSHATLRAVWATLPGRAFEPVQEPIAPEDLRLTLIGPDGARADFEPDPAGAGQFVVRLSIRRGARYRLEGTIMQAHLAAETTVPTEFLVDLPSADTLRPVRNGQRRFPFRFRSIGATHYVADRARFGTDFSIGQSSTSGEGELELDFDAEPYTSRLYALNLDAARYALDRSPVRTNVSGAYGYFGAAIVVAKVVVWQ